MTRETWVAPGVFFGLCSGAVFSPVAPLVMSEVPISGPSHALAFCAYSAEGPLGNVSSCHSAEEVSTSRARHEVSAEAP